MANYTLMHKHVPVVDVTLMRKLGTITAVHEVHHLSHLPVGVRVVDGCVDTPGLNAWFNGRSIPASRDQLRDFLEQNIVYNTHELLEKCLGLSLSDHYWINPKHRPLNWSDVNFFENDFSEDVGNLLFGKTLDGKVDLMSPDNTSDGWLKKKWKRMAGKRCLIKAGSGVFKQEAYNEVIASCIMNRLGIRHVPYTLLVQDHEPFSKCETFVTPNTELVTAWYVMQTKKKQNHISVYQHYLECCEHLGIPGVRDEVDQMMVLDYLIGNVDRHQNNFGVIRDVHTLAWLGMAPVYDSGASLWFDQLTTRIGSDKWLGCKPFKNKHQEQIKLVKSFDWLDLSKLKGLEEDVIEIFTDSAYIDSSRRDAIVEALKQRIIALQAIINKRKTL